MPSKRSQSSKGLIQAASSHFLDPKMPSGDPLLPQLSTTQPEADKSATEQYHEKVPAPFSDPKTILFDPDTCSLESFAESVGSSGESLDLFRALPQPQEEAEEQVALQQPSIILVATKSSLPLPVLPFIHRLRNAMNSPKLIDFYKWLPGNNINTIAINTSLFTHNKDHVTALVNGDLSILPTSTTMSNMARNLTKHGFHKRTRVVLDAGSPCSGPSWCFYFNDRFHEKDLDFALQSTIKIKTPARAKAEAFESESQEAFARRQPIASAPQAARDPTENQQPRAADAHTSSNDSRGGKKQMRVDLDERTGPPSPKAVNDALPRGTEEKFDNKESFKKIPQSDSQDGGGASSSEK